MTKYREDLENFVASPLPRNEVMWGIYRNKWKFIILIAILLSTVMLKADRLQVDVTAYSSTVGQCDSSPFIGAWNNDLRKYSMKSLAVSRDLLTLGIGNGSRVKLKCEDRTYWLIVKDKMNKRFIKRVDIYMGVKHKQARSFGVKKCILIFLNLFAKPYAISD